jgi:hypothetical protein
LLLALFVLAGCGGDDEQEAGAPRAKQTQLTVTVRPKGDKGPARTHTVSDAQGLTAADFAPVPATRACTEIYGGPQTATVIGYLDGREIDADFSRNNGCEIARWDEAAALLDP